MNAIHEELASVDLNLIVAFDALARERSVTRAAHCLGITQSAMSHALRRLRALFGDPLLIRGKSSMVLTPRADALVVPLRSSLVTLGRALAQPSAFDPRSAQRAFALSTPDLFDVLAIPSLLARIRREAPGVDISVSAVDERSLADRLETGELDVAIVPRLEGHQGTEAGLVRRTLFRDRHICYLRASHPALERTLTLAVFAKLSHALVSPRGEGKGLVDEALALHGLERRVALRVPNFYSALAIIAKSDLILTAPKGLARLVGSKVVALPAPLKLPRHSVDMIWHERFSKDAGHSWLRTVVADIGRELTS